MHVAKGIQPLLLALCTLRVVVSGRRLGEEHCHMIVHLQWTAIVDTWPLWWPKEKTAIQPHATYTAPVHRRCSNGVVR